jgi:opine dehydrogenase
MPVNNNERAGTLHMRVAILGAGGVAHAVAAWLLEDGHQPILWSPSGAGTKDLVAGARISFSGVIAGEFDPPVATTCAQAVSTADAVLIAVPAYGHRTVIDAAAPYLRPAQPVILSAQLSLSALYLSRLMIRRGVTLPIAAWAAPVVTVRRTGPVAFTARAKRKRITMAVLPAHAGATMIGECSKLFGDRFELAPDLLSVELSNLNPEIHLALALCNFTRIERGESWRQWEGLTPAVCNYVERLDQERLAVASGFGHVLPDVTKRLRATYGGEGPLARIMRSLQDRDKLAGPNALSTRYVLEDVPFGLTTLTTLARIAGVLTPLHDGGIATVSALYGRDFQRENDVLPELGVDRLSIADMQRVAREGMH